MNKNLLVAFIGIAIAGVSFGLVTPVTVVLLESNSYPTLITGIITTLNYVPFVLLSAFAGKMVQKYGVKKVVITGLSLSVIGTIGHVFWENLFVLLPIRFLAGSGSTLLFVSTEILINAVSNESNRGSNIGLYAVLLSIGIAVGTMLVWTVEVVFWLPFVLGAFVMLAALLVNHFLLSGEIAIQEIEKEEKYSLSQMPLISLFSSFFYGIFESSIFVVLPILGLRINYNTTEVSYLLTSIVVGGIVLLYIVSKLSDRISKYKLLLMIAFILIFLFMIPTISADLLILLILFFTIGGIVPGFYTVGLNYTMDITAKKHMALANAHFITLYGVGTLLGPLLGTTLLELDQTYGYWIFSSAFCLLYFTLFLFQGKLDNS